MLKNSFKFSIINKFFVTKPKNKGIEAILKNSNIKLKEVIKIKFNFIFFFFYLKTIKF